jgi:hypothetical protein
MSPACRRSTGIIVISARTIVRYMKSMLSIEFLLDIYGTYEMK